MLRRAESDAAAMLQSVATHVGERAARSPRIAAMVEIVAGLRPPPAPALGQELHGRIAVPGLNARPWHDAREMAAAGILSARFDELRREAATLRDDGSLDASTCTIAADSTSDNPLRGTWRSFFLHRYFRRVDAAHERCPVAAEALAQISLSREVMYSFLGPRSRIHPHSDLVNFVVTIYLPLVVPPRTALRAGPQTRAWRLGYPVALDSTYRHESWNDSDEERVILIVDTWHPELTPEETVAIRFLMPRVETYLGVRR